MRRTSNVKLIFELNSDVRKVRNIVNVGKAHAGASQSWGVGTGGSGSPARGLGETIQWVLLWHTTVLPYTGLEYVLEQQDGCCFCAAGVLKGLWPPMIHLGRSMTCLSVFEQAFLDAGVCWVVHCVLFESWLLLAADVVGSGICVVGRPGVENCTRQSSPRDALCEGGQQQLWGILKAATVCRQRDTRADTVHSVLRLSLWEKSNSL